MKVNGTLIGFRGVGDGLSLFGAHFYKKVKR